MNTVQLYTRLVGDLDEARRHWRWSKLLEGGLLAGAASAGALVLLIALDHVFQFPVLGRVLLACVFWAVLAVSVSSMVVRRWLEQRRDDFFAVLMEQKHPELNNKLINALQLGRGTDYGSKRLIGAIVSDAVEATAGLQMQDCFDRRPVQRAIIALVVTGVVMLGYATLFTPQFSTGFARLLLPVARIHPYTAAVIDESSIQPTDGKRYPEGTSVDITVRVGGDHLPASAILHRTTDGRNWKSTPLQLVNNQSRESREFKFTVAEARQPFQFFIVAGDDRSDVRRVEIVKRPRVKTISMVYTPPTYTQRKAETVDDSNGEIAGLAGTRVQLTLTSTKPLISSALETETGEVIELTASDNGVTWQGEFVLWQREAKGDPSARPLIAPTRYKARLVDTDGYENADPLWQPITLIKDQAPSIAITAPGRDQQVKIEDGVKLTIESRDDHGVGNTAVLFRVNEEQEEQQLVAFPDDGTARLKTVEQFSWNLTESGIKPGDVVQYWATVKDRNHVTGPGESTSRQFSLFVVTPQQVLATLELQMDDYAAVLQELIRLQRENRAQTDSGMDFETLIVRQTKIRTNTAVLGRAMEKGQLPVATMVSALDELYAGAMSDTIKLLEGGRDAINAAIAADMRDQSLPIQAEIIKRLEELLERLQRNEKARNELRKLRAKDELAHQEITQAISKLVSDLDRLVLEEAELMTDLDKMPKKPVDEWNEQELKSLEELENFQERWSKWQKGTVDELAKLPTGFVDDFGLRQDVNSVYEEIEAVANRPKSSKLEVPLEDLGASKATEMLEDLETWMPDAPDATQWVLEEPLDQKPLAIPEMPLPDALEDLIGDLLQEAEQFDQEADDITSAWGDNLNQAGWAVSDGPISNFSAKGKTGNDLPNTNEVSGRAGDGRRGKSSGQMVGDTARGLEGRKTPARLNNERYEPGQLKEEGRLDPSGSTGGGKKAGTGRRGLQGGTPPDFTRDMQRLSAKQSGMREKAEQIAKQLDSFSSTSRRLNRAIELMKSVENDLRDLRYDDAARNRKIAMQQLQSAFNGVDQTTAVQLHQARELPAHMREQLLQSADEGYPKGYESLLENYFRALSEVDH